MSTTHFPHFQHQNNKKIKARPEPYLKKSCTLKTKSNLSGKQEESYFFTRITACAQKEHEKDDSQKLKNCDILQYTEQGRGK